MALESFPIADLSAAQLTEIEDFLDRQETSHPFQFPQWGDPGTIAMILRAGGGIRWFGSFGVQSPLGRRVPWIRALIANRGPVCSDRELWRATADELAEKMRRDGFAYLDVSPEWLCESEEDRLWQRNDSVWECMGKARASLRLDLRKSGDEIFAGFRKNSRYEVRRAERCGTEVGVAANEAEMEEFLRLYREMVDRKGFSPDPPARLRRVLGWLARSESRGALLMACVDDRIHGGAVIVRAGRRCWYVWGASDQQPHMTVGHILQWKALQWAKAHGCTEYDFGGYTPGATSGPAWFKAGFGGSLVQLVPVHRRVTGPGRYRLLQFLSKIRSSV
ncbi:MAG TPA: GNAT family N-acetyltransferase [Candidatus Solibacter sp.]|nr:GNAT family N-acetyltransferase [Candidatus Solibacter sp.]